ncbi:probable LRR receptor-like serine/threonine-protein kinase At4g29180 [Argentina anserina]|uniref:probable LRR receptor-like serine/threonine-protein kinase At4g29180 n=1 Tax=Argentina anserina TaxID=57926 RepID=UPI0021767FE5|nr:probable LRR receptor-like serine/threonine-protein kinase At4g29180 [Potentilla anserina]
MQVQGVISSYITYIKLFHDSLDETITETPAEEPTGSASIPSKNKNHKSIIASIASSFGIAILILTVLASLWNCKRKRQQGIQNISLQLDDGRLFKYSELVKITNNFSSPIGAGGFGKVYHGILESGIQVAVKLLISASGSSEFQNEVKLLMRARHRNVVSFVGYCNRKTMALVFEYVANGNLLQHLTVSDTGNSLTWNERLQIAVDAARGLDYLHNDCKPPIIHRDIKTSNILLTEKLHAKICDFGVSKLLSTESATHTMTDHVKGTRGYLDPEYYNTGKLNKKSDIYSFGIVLLELITGKTAIIKDVEPEPIHICQWVRPMFERTEIENILDSRIQAGTCNVSSAWKVVGIAMECVSSTTIERPDINNVYKELEECLEIEIPPKIAKVAHVDEDNDDSRTSSSVSVCMTSHTKSESFLVQMNSHIEFETKRHTYHSF